MSFSRGNYGNSGGGYGNDNRGGGYGGGRGGGDRQPYQNNFPNSGALFPVRQKRSDNSPDMTGDVEIGDDVLDYILREAQRGDKVKLDLSAWVRMSRNNQNFQSIKINIPYDVRMREQGNPTYRAQPNSYQQRSQPDRPQPQRQSVRQSYAESTGRGEPLPRYGAEGPSDRDFAAGDRMPDFGMSRHRNDDPNSPPF